MRNKMTLTNDDVKKMNAACKVEAEKNKWNVSIAIVDDGGHLFHMERMDGAPVQSPVIAEGKARAAGLSRMTTKQLEDMVKDRPAFLAVPNRLPIQGGVPLMVNGECVGAIGVSGVKSAEDEQIALAGAAILK